MVRPQRRASLGLVVLLFLAAGSGLAEDTWHWSGVSRVVAVADVHGAYDELVALLQAAGVLGPSLEWIGDDAHLVSTGDLLDRGPASRRVMELLMRLQREAPEQGGAVHVLLGNHEVMNLVGDLRYVSAGEYAAFAGDETEALRAEAFEVFTAGLSPDVSAEEARAAFEARYPAGYFAHRRAFRPDGRYGDWLLSLPAIVVVNDTAYVHGGLSALVAQSTLADINQRVGSTLRRLREVRDRLSEAGALPEIDMEDDLEIALALLASGEEGDRPAGAAPVRLLEEFIALNHAPELGVGGPLWYRGAVYCNPLIEAWVLDAALERLDARRVVVGHTVTDDRRVRALHDGRLIMLDTGMLASHYGGRAAALVSAGDEEHVQYLAPQERAAPERGAVEAHQLSEAELRVALAEGEIAVLSSPQRRGGARALMLRFAGREVEAVFHSRDRRGGTDLELAAHALDRLLGLHLVPPTVAREIDGEAGIVQLRYADALSEAERLERGLPLGTWCAIEPQVQLMNAFDVLIQNPARGPDNILFRRELSALKLIDHQSAFGTQRRVSLAEGALTLPTPLAEALARLDEAALEAALGEWLNARQLRALLERRDALLAVASVE